MDKKIKCTQCGCDDLEEVIFPYKANLIQTAIGIAGESFQYDLDEELYTTTYICTKWGHFEFFNPELAKIILEDRAENARIQNEIIKIDKQVSDKNNEIKNIEQQINSISKQLESIDITIRQSNELKAERQELRNQLDIIKNDIQTLLKRRDSFETKEWRYWKSWIN